MLMLHGPIKAENIIFLGFNGSNGHESAERLKLLASDFKTTGVVVLMEGGGQQESLAFVRD